MQYAEIMGNCGKDAELKYTGDGTAYLKVSVAHTDRRSKETTWWDVSLWGKRAESLVQYITKGKTIFAAGDFTMKPRDNGGMWLNLRAERIEFAGGGKREQAQQQDDEPDPLA